ncbi:hypothetical protein QFC20_007149 [Naganishia adeliensis]|uniref:Uncharacterized protein n=1 Tax=Naganishia adeliensis TaxID=92952 RepID=A0ACC2V3U5_9TREE|nr:hypothetical protein QFC20_007149 [Naganishia adeliensis]
MKEEQVPMALQSPAPSSLTGVRTISFLTPSQQEEHDSRERAIASGWRVTAKIIPNPKITNNLKVSWQIVEATNGNSYGYGNDALAEQADVPGDLVLGLAAMAQAAKVTLVPKNPKITETHDAHNAAA